MCLSPTPYASLRNAKTGAIYSGGTAICCLLTVHKQVLHFTFGLEYLPQDGSAFYADIDKITADIGYDSAEATKL